MQRKRHCNHDAGYDSVHLNSTVRKPLRKPRSFFNPYKCFGRFSKKSVVAVAVGTLVLCYSGTINIQWKSSIVDDPILRNAHIMETANVSTLNPREAITTGFRRFESITGSTGVYTSTECIEASITCGHACGNIQVASMACWCIRIHNWTVSYFPKTDKDNDGEDITTWNSDLFGSLHHSLNLLQTVVKQRGLAFSKPVYLLVNVYDYPRLFVPEVDPSLPSVAPGHPSEAIHDVDFIQGYNTFKAGFPSCLESCSAWNIRPTLFRRCYWGLLLHHQPRECCDVRNHFPIFSWSVNPVYNFDILVPNRHPGSCSKDFMDHAIAKTPWTEKSRTVVFRGNTGQCKKTRKNPRSTFCALIQNRREQLEKEMDVKLDVFGDRLSPAQQSKSKFLVLLDGAVAAFRSTWYLSTGSVILSAGLHADVRTSLLRPYVHYIPFRPDFSDFSEALGLVAKDEKYAIWVANNGRAAGAALSENGRVLDGGHSFDKAYWGEVLTFYGGRYEFRERDEDARRFTTDRQCDGFRTAKRSRLKNEKCLGVEYACERLLQDGFLANPNVKFI